MVAKYESLACEQKLWVLVHMELQSVFMCTSLSTSVRLIEVCLRYLDVNGTLGINTGYQN